jgi:hypothetical protein
MWPAIIFGTVLIVLSVGLMISHAMARRSQTMSALDDEERTYLARRFRRRMQASALIGVVGVAVLGGLWVDRPPGEALYWCGVFLLVIWILILAGADAASTQSFFREMQSRRAAEHVALHKEIERYRRHEGNGQNEKENTYTP